MDTRTYLSLDCESSGQTVPCAGTDEHKMGPIFAIGGCVFTFEFGAPVIHSQFQISYAPRDDEFDESTRAWWNKPENAPALRRLCLEAQFANEKDLMTHFYEKVLMPIFQSYPDIVIVSDCIVFDVAYLAERCRLHVSSTIPHFTLRNGSFVNTFDAATLELLFKSMEGQAAVDAMYAASPVKHTHCPAEDAVCAAHMMAGQLKYLGLI